MKDFRGGRGGGFGGGARGGFQKKSWGGSNRGDREITMHEAICASCNKNCEVPFRPVDGRPVYCKDCFGGKEDRGGESRGGDRGFKMREFSPKPARPSFGGPRNDSRGGDAGSSKELAAISAKLDRVIDALQALANSSPKKSAPEAKSESKGESLTSTVKKVAKKAKAKKAKK